MMNRDSNVYTVLYAAVLVVVVAAVLAVAAGALKEPQERNREIEKKMNILMSVGKASDVNQADDKNTYIENEYKKYIVEAFLVNANGVKTEGDAFNADLKAELKKAEKERLLPVFICNDNGTRQYIIPVRGAGLWGAIWGYISLKDDFNTVYGAVFDHAGETPGLGAEIAESDFQKQFSGKQIYRDGKFIAVEVIKNGSAPLNDYSVDGITGGTLTSKAVGKMLFDCLSNYTNFFDVQKQNN
ncbi:MAG: NADH:ubiquinone reductase (Na(+)-transporting) subunit C [Prevotellaceae bacterium]|jgi:Na+-transporting NADH:ubiquinone oxidoreductase subunit C|nr:NADH:ubiquinone reductase (Na(+)-transporting) subunit C [Prevotellaceae bacterium]